MEIIVEGHKIDTKDIWDVQKVVNTREVSVTIKVVGKSDIVFGRRIPYETRTGEFNKYWQPYEDLYKSVKDKWESDKSNIELFKLK